MSTDVIRFFLHYLRYFTPEETKLLRSKQISVTVVKEIPGGDGETVALGGYNGKHHGKHEIVLDTSSVTEETLTHELTHVLQEEGVKRPDIEKHLKVAEMVKEKNKRTFDEKLTLKEAMTEAETLTRCENPDEDSGYYAFLPKSSPIRGEEAKIHDRNLLYRGKSDDYIRDMSKLFDKTLIKNLKLRSSRKSASQVKKDMQKRR